MVPGVTKRGTINKAIAERGTWTRTRNLFPLYKGMGWDGWKEGWMDATLFLLARGLVPKEEVVYVLLRYQQRF